MRQEASYDGWRGMIWWILGLIFVGALAFGIGRATKGTPFRHNCGCTPNIGRLKRMEVDEDSEQGRKLPREGL